MSSSKRGVAKRIYELETLLWLHSQLGSRRYIEALQSNVRLPGDNTGDNKANQILSTTKWNFSETKGDITHRKHSRHQSAPSNQIYIYSACKIP